MCHSHDSPTKAGMYDGDYTDRKKQTEASKGVKAYEGTWKGGRRPREPWKIDMDMVS